MELKPLSEAEGTDARSETNHVIVSPQEEPSELNSVDSHLELQSDAKATQHASTNTRSKAKHKELSNSQLKQRSANVVVQSRLKPTLFAYDASASYPNVTSQHEVKGTTFYQFDDLPLNRRGFKYKPCRPNRLLEANKYSATELPPCTVRVSYFDKSQGIACSEDMLSVTTQHGWLSARCNVPMREGKTYFEYEIIDANNENNKAHVRIGIGRRESALDAPVGFDGYGYGLRDLTGQKITLSRPQEFMKTGFSSGDVVGFLVELPPLQAQRISNAKFASDFQQTRHKKRKSDHLAVDKEERNLNVYNNIVRDQIAIKYKNGLFFEQFEYTKTKQMDHLLNPVTVFGEKAVLESNVDNAPKVPTIPESRVIVYKNGQCVGEMFTDLYSFLPLNILDDAAATDANTAQQQNVSYRNTDDGSLGYYPMMSVFQNGVVKINGGPNFKHPLPEGAVALCERLDENIIEDWYWDLVDEVEAEYLDSFD